MQMPLQTPSLERDGDRMIINLGPSHTVSYTHLTLPTSDLV